MFLAFRLKNDSFGYALAVNSVGSLALFGVRSEGNVFLPTDLSCLHPKWRAIQSVGRIDRDMWALSMIEPVPVRFKAHISQGFDFSTDDWQLTVTTYVDDGLWPPTVKSWVASEEDLNKFPRTHISGDIGVFADERFDELELINDNPDWTLVSPEKLVKSKRRRVKPKATGEHRIEVHVSDFSSTEIYSRMDLEQDIQEAIGDHGFVSGGGSLVGPSGEESGDLDIDCSADDVPAVLRAVRSVLKAGKAHPDTVIVDVTLMDDGSEKLQNHRLGSD